MIYHKRDRLRLVAVTSTSVARYKFGPFDEGEIVEAAVMGLTATDGQTVTSVLTGTIDPVTGVIGAGAIATSLRYGFAAVQIAAFTSEPVENVDMATQNGRLLTVGRPKVPLNMAVSLPIQWQCAGYERWLLFQFDDADEVTSFTGYLDVVMGRQIDVESVR